MVTAMVTARSTSMDMGKQTLYLPKGVLHPNSFGRCKTKSIAISLVELFAKIL
jgi:hypothetical protein